MVCLCMCVYVTHCIQAFSKHTGSKFIHDVAFWNITITFSCFSHFNDSPYQPHLSDTSSCVFSWFLVLLLFKCQFSVISICLSHMHTAHCNCQGWLMVSIRAISLTAASSDRLQNLWSSRLCQRRMNGLLFTFLFLNFYQSVCIPTTVHPFLCLWLEEWECVVMREAKVDMHRHPPITFECCSVVLFHIVMDGWDQTGWKMDGGESHPSLLRSRTIPSILIVSPILITVHVNEFVFDFVFY